MLNGLPEDWETKKFSELGQVISGGTPSRDNPGYWHGKIPWLTPGEISSNAVKYHSETEENISSSGLNGSGANLLPENSLMITSRATLGARAINTVPMATNQGFKNVVFYDSEDSGFYYYLLDLVKPEMIRRASGTTFLEISSKEFSDIDLSVPPKEERLAIENTFDTLDTTIRQTEAIIAKLQQVQQGLLHDLLTRGIDNSGQLRPPQHLAPELYKKSPLGWIPKGWKCVSLGQLAHFQRGHDIVEREFVEGSYPVVSSSGVIGFHSKYTSKGPNVVIGRKGSIGKVHYLGSNFWAHDTSLYTTNFFGNSEKFIYFLCTFLNLSTYGTKSGSPSLNRNDIHPILVGKPSVKEQHSICEKIEAHEHRISSEKIRLDKLKSSKSGLMNDLLTGKKRVTSLL